MNDFAIDGLLLEFAVDRSIIKLDCDNPGIHLPLHAHEKPLQASLDYALLTRNFSDDIPAMLAAFRRITHLMSDRGLVAPGWRQ